MFEAPGIPPVIGHRGALAHAPENTLAAIEKARRLGCSWVEVDVALTRDAVPVLFHDAELRRTTGAAGLLAETGLADLPHLDAGAWFGAAFRGETVPTLEAAIGLISDLGMGANLEIKPTPGTDVETAQAAARVVRDAWPETSPPPLFSSFSATALAAAFAAAPEVERAFLVHDPRPSAWRRVCADLGCSALHVDNRFATPGLIQSAHAEGLALRVYTVNAPHRAARLFAWGADGVFSDRPERILPVAPALI